MNQSLFALVAVLAASALSVACAGRDDDDDDEDGRNPVDCSFTACGGDLVGSWTITGSCEATGLEGIPECSDAVVSGFPTTTGTITFADDGSFTRRTRTTGTQHLVIDEDCLAVATRGTMTGEEYCQMADAAAHGGRGTTGSCSFAGGTCTCDLTYDLATELPGTYSVTGNQVTMGDLPSDYCVDGDELKLLLDGSLAVLSREDGGGGGAGGTGGSGDVCDYEPCGGDPAGTWIAADACAVGVEDFGDHEACRDLPVQVTVDVTGRLTYANATETSTLFFDDYELVYTLPFACVDALGDGRGDPTTAAATCAGRGRALEDAWLGFCTWEASEGCTCTLDLSGDWSWSAPYEIRGHTLVFPGDNGETHTDFCVHGNLQQQDWYDFVLVLNKQ